MKSIGIDDLKQMPFWINWLYKKNEDGKLTKVPFSSRGGRTGTNDQYKETWGSFIEASNLVNKKLASGAGFVLQKVSEELALAVIDIDHKKLDDAITQDIISLFNTYTEYSPSGDGFHIWFLVNTNRLPVNLEQYYMKNSYNQLECYIAGVTNRYITFTGNVVVNQNINERTEQLVQFLNRYMLKSIINVEIPKTTEFNENIISSVPKDDDVIIQTILGTKQKDKFVALYYNGDKSEYNDDDSSADMALATILAFYTGPDFERIDKLMADSKLYRVKWNRADYKEMTIKKAIANCNGNYFNWDNIQMQEYTNAKPKLTIESYTARELLELNLKEPMPIVKGMLFPGFSILAGSPKVGKSWLCLDLGISTSRGETFLTFDTNAVETLYLALEDSETRLKSRISKILGPGGVAPNNFHIATNCHGLDEGLLIELENKIKENPNIKLIIIDTLQKVRGAQVRGETWYASDYKEIAKLKKFADENELCILAIHHLRKQKDSDVFNQISGSTRNYWGFGLNDST